MDDRRRALMWAIAWWIARRYIRRRATLAVSGLAAAATPRRGRLWGVLGAVVLVAALAGAFVAWRRLAAPSTDDWDSSEAVVPPTDAPVPTAAA